MCEKTCPAPPPGRHFLLPSTGGEVGEGEGRSGRGGGTWRPSMLRRRSLTPIELLSVRVFLIDLKRVLELDLAVPIGFHGTGFRLKAPRARDLSANTPRPLPTRDRADRSIPTSHLAGRQVSRSLSVALLPLARARRKSKSLGKSVKQKTTRRHETDRGRGNERAWRERRRRRRRRRWHPDLPPYGRSAWARTM